MNNTTWIRRAVTVTVVGALVSAVSGTPPIHAGQSGQAGQRGQSSEDMMRQLMDPRPERGQNVAPVYEGWEPNPDGTFDLYFGYINRNWSEALDIPIGTGNFFEPGPQDRGQPTHFLPRRHKQTFKVTVPKDFGKQTLVWTLSIRGSTEKVPGSLKPELQIDVAKETASGNRQPELTVAAPPSARVGEPYKLVATVKDDGIPKPQASSEDPRSRPNVRWSKYRGPAAVQFGSEITPISGDTSSTTALFSQPGEYVIQALADDGSMLATSQGQNVPGFSCCWTTVHVKVSVAPGGSR